LTEGTYGLAFEDGLMIVVWDGQDEVMTTHFNRGFLASATGPLRALIGPTAQAAFATNPIGTVQATDFLSISRRMPAVKYVIREIEIRDGLRYSDRPAYVLAAAVVLWHRRRLGL
jgi:hypothetical protein